MPSVRGSAAARKQVTDRDAVRLSRDRGAREVLERLADAGLLVQRERDAPDPEVAGYRIRYRPEGGGAWQTQDFDGTSVLLTGVDGCYDVELASLDATGAGPWGGTFGDMEWPCTRAPLEAPTFMSAGAVSSWFASATVRWRPVFDAVGYRVRYTVAGLDAWVTLDDVPASQTSVVLRGLAPGTRYEVALAAVAADPLVGAVTSPWSSAEAFRTTSAPAAPQDLSVTATGASTVAVSWQWRQVTFPPDSYLVRYATGDEAWVVVEVPATGTSATLTGLRSATTYRVQVAAIVDAFTTSWTAEAIVTTDGPEPPTLTDVHVGPTWLEFLVVPSVDPAVTGHRIRYRDQGGAERTADFTGDSVLLAGLRGCYEVAFASLAGDVVGPWRSETFEDPLCAVGGSAPDLDRPTTPRASRPAPTPDTVIGVGLTLEGDGTDEPAPEPDGAQGVPEPAAGDAPAEPAEPADGGTTAPPGAAGPGDGGTSPLATAGWIALGGLVAVGGGLAVAKAAGAAGLGSVRRRLR